MPSVLAGWWLTTAMTTRRGLPCTVRVGGWARCPMSASTFSSRPPAPSFCLDHRRRSPLSVVCVVHITVYRWGGGRFAPHPPAGLRRLCFLLYLFFCLHHLASTSRYPVYTCFARGPTSRFVNVNRRDNKRSDVVRIAKRSALERSTRSRVPGHYCKLVCTP